ncbi:hypothetical protein HY382_02155 [Candidatus Curtissbacteria bacterium]|nr:hypothetical protein [Candidatus Curtissbacteria bacterium]
MKESDFQGQTQKQQSRLRTVENAISKTGRLVDLVVLPGKDPQIVALVQSRLIERALPFLTAEAEEASEMVNRLEAVNMLEGVVAKVKSGVDEGTLSPVHLESLQKRLERAKEELTPRKTEGDLKKREEIKSFLHEQFGVALPVNLDIDDVSVIEALLFGSGEKPVTKEEICEHVWGSKYQPEIAGLKLSIGISRIRRAFLQSGLDIKLDQGKNGYFIGNKVKDNEKEVGKLVPQTQIIIATRQSITLTSEQTIVVANLIDSISDEAIKEILSLSGGDLESIVGDMGDLSKLIAAVQSGEISIPDSGDFLEAKESGMTAQIESVKERMRGLLAFVITKMGEVKEPNRGLKATIGREIHRLKFYLGSLQGQEIIVRAIREMSNLEAILVYNAMSTNIKKELEFPDADTCNESQMAEYFKASAYHKFGYGAKTRRSKDKDFGMIEQLVMSCYERMDEEGFNVGKVMDLLCEEVYADNVFEKLVEAANFRSCLFELACVFSQSAETSRLARYCREVLAGEREIRVPLWMRE